MGLSSNSNLLILKHTFPYFRIPNLLLNSFCSLPPKPSSLSPRMSFVFDQINHHPEEDYQTFLLIRALRESKLPKPNTQLPTSPLQGGRVNDSVGTQKESVSVPENQNGVVGIPKDLTLVHPWPEWMELIQRLLQQNYFDNMLGHEDKLLKRDSKEPRKPDLTKDWKTVEVSVFHFARDRFDIFRSLSRNHLKILVGSGCPRTDKRTIIAAKRLRKYVSLNEGLVCSSCSLRSSCQIPYLLLEKEDEARTTDVMRMLLTYGFDPINRPAMNKSLAKLKSVKTSVRKLLDEVVRLSAVPIDPNLPPPVSKEPLVEVKKSPSPSKRPSKKRVCVDIEMKKGDWLCSKCEVMNFAKNTVCLKCDAKPPKQRPLPGEWKSPR